MRHLSTVVVHVPRAASRTAHWEGSSHLSRLAGTALLRDGDATAPSQGERGQECMKKHLEMGVTVAAWGGVDLRYFELTYLWIADIHIPRFVSESPR
jgi:hypothetical protein